jgi:hypothetical protein
MSSVSMTANHPAGQKPAASASNGPGETIEAEPD